MKLPAKTELSFSFESTFSNYCFQAVLEPQLIKPSGRRKLRGVLEVAMRPALAPRDSAEGSAH
jgi:hypothetical protein